MWSSIRDFSFILCAVGILVWILVRPNQTEVSRLIEPQSMSPVSNSHEILNAEKSETAVLPTRKVKQGKAEITSELKAQIRNRIAMRMADLEYRTASREKRKALREKIRSDIHREILAQTTKVVEPKKSTPLKTRIARNNKVPKKSLKVNKLVAEEEIRLKAIDAIADQGEKELDRHANALAGIESEADGIDFNSLKMPEVAMLKIEGDRKKSDLQMANDFFDEIDSYINDLDQDLE